MNVIRKFKILFIIIPILFLGLLIHVFLNTPTNIVKYNSSYSYLSKEAKNFILDIYKETNELPKTEYNKVKGDVYLNPEFLDYLSLSQNEKEKIDTIPEVYNTDLKYEELNDNNIPSYFNLNNVGGSVYTTPLKNQKNLGICWDFAAIEQIESLLMIQKQTPYNVNTTTLFSARQLDYAASTDGIKDYENVNGFRELTEGGNFITSSVTMARGLSLVSEDKMPINYDVDQKELYEVLNYDNSMYELDSSIMFSQPESFDNEEEFLMYLNTIKTNVMTYGGGHVSTRGPGSSCTSINQDGYYIIRVDDACIKDSGHAMQIIGWDDNYSYSYCQGDKSHSSNINNCSPDKRVSGTGAWIVRNSWGNNTPYVYLAYDTQQASIAFATEVESMENRDWDNSYYNYIDHTLFTLMTNINQTFNKNINTEEKLNKIKFLTLTQDGQYNITIKANGVTYNNVKSINTSYPGIYTIDFSDNNIVLDGDNFEINIKSTNSKSIVKNSIIAFTTNIENKPILQFNDESLVLNNLVNDYSFRLYSSTKNIPSNGVVQYNLYNNKDNLSNDYLQYNNNIIAINNINTLISINKNIPNGIYKLRASYNDYYNDYTINVGNVLHQVKYYSNFGDNNYNVDSIYSDEVEVSNNSFIRNGYIFKNWNTKTDGSGDTYNYLDIISNASEDITLYAQWDPINYEIKFDANGGSGQMSNQSFVYDKNILLNENTYVREGYIFKNWNTKIDGSGDTYSDKNNIYNLTIINNDIITLYAQWDLLEEINISYYDVDNNKKYIDSIKLNTTSNSMKENMNINPLYNVLIDTKNNYVYTGSKTKIYYNDNLLIQYTNIVRGDINGDALVNSADLLKVRQHLLNLKVLTKENLYAADINKDNAVNSADLLRVRQHLLGKKLIS